MARYEERSLNALDELRLDPHNPRLRKDEEGSPQPVLIEIMLARFKIEEVAESILAAGWLEQDPLIAVEENGEVLVVEGNRRLTAVKLLLDPTLAPVPRRARWEKYAEGLPQGVRDAIQTLDVRVYESRDDPEVSSYIGFRHVTGVLPWPALEKASYIARLAEKGATYQALAEKLGSYPSHVQRHHVAYQIVEQADEWEVDGSAQMGDAFGVLLRALQAEGVRQYLQLNPDVDPKGNLRPIPAAAREEFADFVAWTFGTDKRPRVLPESRELTKWSRILVSPAAIRYLKHAEEPKFERAWARSGGEGESLADSLWRASYLLADVIPLLDEHLDDEAVQEAASECERYMRQISARLEQGGAAQGD